MYSVHLTYVQNLTQKKHIGLDNTVLIFTYRKKYNKNYNH